MISVIGLGAVGSRVAASFKKYPQYDIYNISEKKEDEEVKFCRLQQRGSPEEYEKEVPDMSVFLQNVRESILFVVSGVNFASAASLAVLEQIKDGCSISILYIKPEAEFLTGNQKLNERTVRMILQQYALSGVFGGFCIVDNAMLQAAVGDVPISKLYPTINSFICNTFHMISVFENSKPQIGNLQESIKKNSVSTMAVLDPESGTMTAFAEIATPRAIACLYGIPQDDLETDASLLGRIRGQVKNIPVDGPKCYGIFSTKYEHVCAFAVQYSRETQK